MQTTRLLHLPAKIPGEEGLQLAACEWESVKLSLTEDGKLLSLSFLLRGSPGTCESASLSRVIPQTMLTLLKKYFQKMLGTCCSVSREQNQGKDLFYVVH